MSIKSRIARKGFIDIKQWDGGRAYIKASSITRVVTHENKKDCVIWLDTGCVVTPESYDNILTKIDNARHDTQAQSRMLAKVLDNIQKGFGAAVQTLSEHAEASRKVREDLEWEESESNERH